MSETDTMGLEGKGLVAEIWQNAKGGWQARYKVTKDVTPSELADLLIQLKNEVEARFTALKG